jgi:magnesium-transporting ATPase (P-type)
MKTILRFLFMIGILLLGLVILNSCDIQKKSLKNKTDRQLSEITETKVFRKGDTVRYIVPKITYKDTTIVKKNYVTGTTQVVRYNEVGQVSGVECISGAIEEFTKSNKLLIEAIKQKDNASEHNFDSKVIIYFMLGLALIVAITLFIVFKNLSSQAKAITEILKKVN